MIRFLILYKKPHDIQAFEHHYNKVHIPLSKELPGLRRYALSRNIVSVRGDEPYYLIAELEWDNMEALKKAFQSPEGQATAQDVSDNLEKLSSGVQSMIYELKDVNILNLGY